MYQAKQTIQLKQGNSFRLLVGYTDEVNNPLPITGIDIKADIKDEYQQLVAPMVVTRIDDIKGVFALSLPPLATLPARSLYCDIRMVQNGTVRNSDIVRLSFSEVVTHG